MPTLSQLKNQTVPAKVEIGGGNFITLDVRAQRGTVTDKREFSELIQQSAQHVQAKAERAAALQKEKDALLEPAQKLVNERAALIESEGETDAKAVSAIEAKITKAREGIKADLDALNAQIDECDLEGETTLHESLARQLAFYVASTDVTTEEGTPIEPSFEFFRDEFSFKLLEKSLEAVSQAINGPLVTPDSTEN